VFKTFEKKNVYSYELNFIQCFSVCLMVTVLTSHSMIRAFFLCGEDEKAVDNI